MNYSTALNVGLNAIFACIDNDEIVFPKLKLEMIGALINSIVTEQDPEDPEHSILLGIDPQNIYRANIARRLLREVLQVEGALATLHHKLVPSYTKLLAEHLYLTNVYTIQDVLRLILTRSHLPCVRNLIASSEILTDLSYAPAQRAQVNQVMVDGLYALSKESSDDGYLYNGLGIKWVEMLGAYDVWKLFDDRCPVMGEEQGRNERLNAALIHPRGVIKPIDKPSNLTPVIAFRILANTLQSDFDRLDSVANLPRIADV